MRNLTYDLISHARKGINNTTTSPIQYYLSITPILRRRQSYTRASPKGINTADSSHTSHPIVC